MEKNWKKRWMAGAMAFALCCTTLLQTGASAVSAAEVGGVSAQSETQIEVQTETLALKAAPLANGYVKARTGDSTTDEVYNGWYGAVYMPAAASTSTDETGGGTA